LYEKEKAPEHDKKVVPEGSKGAVDFNKVVFGYNPDKIIIRDFSASIKPGKELPLSGPTAQAKYNSESVNAIYDVNKAH